jgi:hypothetical protein
MRSFALALAVSVAGALAPSPAAAQPVVADYFSSYQAVRVVGDRAYVAAAAGLVIYDVSDRSQPRSLSRLFLDRSGSFKLEVSGNFAYVLSGAIFFERTILRVIDVSDPQAPRQVGEYTDLAESRVQGMLLMGTTLALANANAVDLVDVSDPSQPAKLATLPIVSEPEQVVGLAAHGSTLFAAWQGLGGDLPLGGVTAIDIANPSAPTQVSVLNLDQPPYGIAGAGAALYVGITTDVVVLDASDPAELVEVTRLDFPLSSDTELYAEGARLFVGVQPVEGQFSVSVFDVQNPLAPQLLGQEALPCHVTGMDFDGPQSDAFMPCADARGGGMTIFDLTAGGDLAELASIRVPEVHDVQVSGDATFLVGSNTISAVRPAGDGTVETLGRLDLPQRAIHLQVVGTRAYVSTADNLSGLNLNIRIVDVTDPANMSLAGSLAVDGQSYLVTSKRFHVVGTTLYVATPTGLDIYDASNAAQLQRLGSFATPDPAVNVLVSDKFAYLVTRRLEDGLQEIDLYVVNIRKPANPKRKGRLRSVDTATYANDLALADGRLYMLDAGPGSLLPNAGDGRLIVVDVSKAGKPRVRSAIPSNPDFSGYAFEIAVSGTRAYVADGLGGVSVISVADDSAPEYLRSIDTPGFATGIWLDGARLSVADQSSYQVYDGSQ